MKPEDIKKLEEVKNKTSNPLMKKDIESKLEKLTNNKPVEK